MAEAKLERWHAILAGAVIIGTTVIGLLGVTHSVQTLQDRVGRLEVATTQIDQIEARVMRLQREAAQIEHIRQDILQAICAANARDHGDVERCFRSLL